MSDHKKRARSWFKDLQNQICSAFEELEDAYCKQHPHLTPGRFKETSWLRGNQEGGGYMRLMRGNVFEKVGVNVSEVYGEFSEKFRSEVPGALEHPQFWASGISLVAHMHSPHVPAVHMNTRHMITQKGWFGGGADLTPFFPIEEDNKDFHGAFKAACDAYNPTCYPQFKKQCDDYFYLPHRQEPRGIGGIFYDNLSSEDWEKDFLFTQNVGKAFLNIYPQIVRRRMQIPWTPEERHYQLVRRGRYVEFNLLYDRGTRFGFQTGGHTEAILMSMPPEVLWP